MGVLHCAMLKILLSETIAANCMLTCLKHMIYIQGVGWKVHGEGGNR